MTRKDQRARASPKKQKWITLSGPRTVIFVCSQCTKRVPMTSSLVSASAFGQLSRVRADDCLTGVLHIFIYYYECSQYYLLSTTPLAPVLRLICSHVFPCSSDREIPEPCKHTTSCFQDKLSIVVSLVACAQTGHRETSFKRILSFENDCGSYALLD